MPPQHDEHIGVLPVRRKEPDVSLRHGSGITKEEDQVTQPMLLPEAMVQEAQKALTIGRPQPYVWFMSPNALENLTKCWQANLGPLNLHLSADGKIDKFFNIPIHEEDTWAWGWCLFDADQLTKMGYPLPDGR